jgi:hypothetical protein
MVRAILEAGSVCAQALRLGVVGLIALFELAAAPAVQGDVVQYLIPNTRTVVTLQGETTVHPGRTVSFRHPKFGKLIFGLQNARIHETPTIEARFERMLGRAQRAKNVDDVIVAARFALKHGLLPEFYSAIDAALELDASNRPARRVRYLQREMAKPIAESPEDEASLHKLVSRSEMRIAKSPHFMLLHDTPEKPAGNRKMNRAQERLDLLETVYESFLLKFYFDNVKLDLPQKRLQVVLFAHKDDYLRFATRLDPALQSAAGFWSTEINVSFFYNQGTGEGLQSLSALSDKLQELKAQAIKVRAANAREIVRMTNTITLLVEVAKENQDIEVVTHEATHQLAGNTGLLPRDVQIPIWVHEGLATYFEAPNDATWSGIGAVNERRLDAYRGLEKDRTHSNIDFVSQDKIFTRAGNIESRLHGYGQAWALTHFLMDRYFAELVQYYKLLGEQPKDTRISEAKLQTLFSQAFGKNRSTLDAEWREYMGSLKTDIQIMLEEKNRDR